LAGIAVGESGASARVTVGSGDGGTCARSWTLRYPGAVRSVVGAVRAAVAEDLSWLAGHRMRALAVTVAVPNRAHHAARRRRATLLY
jgi:hypothetical protein